MTTQWGAPLTGAQMKLLRAAGLPDGTEYQFLGVRGWMSSYTMPLRWNQHQHDGYRLPANHIAYTLLEAGWLDGRNVVLWFGGEKAPGDWDGGGVLLADGFTGGGVDWRHNGGGCDIIAYTRKAEYRKETMNACQSFDETVTIAKMTEAEAGVRFGIPDNAEHLSDYGRGIWDTLLELGLIREPTRLERFWATWDTKDVYGPPCKAFQLIEEALNFERD